MAVEKVETDISEIGSSSGSFGRPDLPFLVYTFRKYLLSSCHAGIFLQIPVPKTFTIE